MQSRAPSNPFLQPEEEIESSSLQIKLKFLKWQAIYEIEKPFQIFINIPPCAADQRTTNLVYEDVSLLVKDVRCLRSQPTLDHNGFIYCKHRTNVMDFTSRDHVDKYYLREMEALLKSKVDGVDRIFFFDWRVSFLAARRA
jgi:hypothetical protein